MAEQSEPPRKFSRQEHVPARLPDWRCHGCGGLLARIRLSAGVVEIKCRNCNTVNVREAA
jgi:LSD1 subclass zinc finger protein